MRKILDELFRFLLLAVAGLTLDLLLFSLGIWLGLSVFLANLSSSGLALLTVYHLAVKQVFKTDGSWFRLVAFFSWYAFSIVTFSFLAEWLHANTPATEIQSKLAIIGPSFFSNFFAVRTILRFPRSKAFSNAN
jgi:hypothetical protein